MRQERQEQISNSALDSDESNKNDEDCLAFSSKYKTTMYKEEDSFKENDTKSPNGKRKISCDSTSISYSQEFSNLSDISKNFNNILKDEILNKSIEFKESKNKYQERQRKMSSPLCCYFYGSEEFLSKTQKTNVDINNSQNFVKKEVLFNKSSKLVNNYNSKRSLNNNKIEANNLNFKLVEQNINKNEDKNIIKNEKKLSFNGNQMYFGQNNSFIPNQNLNYMNSPVNYNNMLYFNNNYQQQLYNLNCMNFNNNIVKRRLSFNIEEGIIGNYFNNILNFDNNYQYAQNNFHPILFSYNDESQNNDLNDNSKKVGDKKPFDRRKGDWVCSECHNLNFAFRVECNRCKLPKPKNINIEDNSVNKQK
jgi:hypothetical protein